MRRMSMYYTRTERRDPIFSTQGQEGKDFYILQNRGVVISTRRGRTSIFYMRTGKTSTFTQGKDGKDFYILHKDRRGRLIN